MDILDRLHDARMILWGDLETARIYGCLRADRSGASAEMLSRIESHWTAAGVSRGTRILVDMLCDAQTPARFDLHLRGFPTEGSKRDIGLVQHALGSAAEVLGIRGKAA